MPYSNYLSLPSYLHKYFSGILLFVVLFAAGSCDRKPPYQADVSKVNIDPVKILRYDYALFSIDPLNMREELDPFIDDFYLFLGEEINTPMGQQQLYDYITDPFIREVYEDMAEVWGDPGNLERQLTNAFRYYKYHFPDREIPQIYTYVSGIDFEMPVFFQDDVVVIGLDMFLGKNYPKYDRIGIPVFKRARFIPEALPAEVMRSIAITLTSRNQFRPETLLDFMISEGKLLYFLDCMLPLTADSLKIYYSSEQAHWALTNEGLAWTFLINNEMLYSTDRQLIQKMIGDAPFTAPFSGSSAPRMGIYNGWQIVREYMRRNPEVSLSELLFDKKRLT
jgi:hypothetical protein